MILLTAHRGFAGQAPENTLVSYEESLQFHPDAVELDIRATKDGRLVVMHDAAVDRTTNGTGKVSEMTLDELKQLDAGSWKDLRYAGTKVPTFREALELLKGRAWVWVELKEEGLEKAFIGEVKAAGMLGQVAVPSFHGNAILRVKEMEPTIPTALNVSLGTDFNIAEVLARVQQVRANALSINHQAISREVIAAAKSRGIAIWAWTLDQPADIERGIDLDVDAITSNYPNRAREILLRRGEAIRE